MNEVDILKKLRHRNIIQYYDHFICHEHKGKEVWLVMDYAENGTLTKFINGNKDKVHNCHNWKLNIDLIKQMS